MGDQPIRTQNAVLLFALQTAEDVPAVPNPLTDAIPFEGDSLNYNGPWSSEQSSEVTGSLVSGAPLISGQPATLSFRSRLKGAGPGKVYSSSVKPPLHAPLQACGMRGQFLAAIPPTALVSGTTASATLDAPFAAQIQQYRGVPLMLSGGPGAGQMPIISDYGVDRVASFNMLFTTALSSATLAAMPALWTYAGTSPGDATARLVDQPCATVYLYEDGVLHQWINVRGTVDFNGNSAKPGFATFNLTGVYVGDGIDAAVPANAIVANHSAPVLVQGSGLGPVMVANRRGLPITSWSMTTGGQVESPDDPNTQYGYGAAQVAGRTPTFEADPKRTLVSARNTLTEIRQLSRYPISLAFASSMGNRVALTAPLAQPFDSQPGTSGSFRNEAYKAQLLSGGKDAFGRDGDRILTFY